MNNQEEKNEFFQQMEDKFRQILSHHKIAIKNTQTGQILEKEDMNYNRILFDKDLNIYKINKDNQLEKVDHEKGYEAVVMKY